MDQRRTRRVAQRIREDRILHEAIATHGDVCRLCDLFGISVATAQRYVDVIAKPNEHDLTTPDRVADQQA